MKLRTFFLTSLVGMVLTFASCGGKKRGFEKSPVDDLIRDLSVYDNFSVILYDMDYFEDADAYKHQYQVVYNDPKQDSIHSYKTDWKTVSDEFFAKHQENMGMEIVSKSNGKLNKAATPPGYSNYVGNEKYGSWQQSNGQSFWAFYGQYMFLSSMFRMAMFPVYYNQFYDYRNNYYRYGRSYYGGSGYTSYGTQSNYNRSNKGSSWNNKSTSFRQNVRSKVKRSSAASKRSRTSSRFGGRSYRSRGGGFGK